MAEQKISPDDVEAEAEHTIAASRALMKACRERQSARAATKKKLKIDNNWPERLMAIMGPVNVKAARASSDKFVSLIEDGFHKSIANAKREHMRQSAHGRTGHTAKPKRPKISV